jgi:CRP/FNR family transcriptional regulator, cyclic AMP receptor protein
MSFGSKSSDRSKLLADVPFFEGFSEDELRRVVSLSDEVTSPAGSVLIDQGDTGVDCYVIVEGEASIYVRGEFVNSVGRGSMVGEMALVDHRPRTATVVADTDLQLLRFDSRAFRKLLDEMPKASERVMRQLQARLNPS